MEGIDLEFGAANGRIVFPGNPWPAGHAIEEFAWTGRLDRVGNLWFDLHLRSADYAADGLPDAPAEEAPDWSAPAVWTNYHRCTLSSTYWGEDDGTGFLAATPGKLFQLKAAAPQRLTADPLPITEPDDLEYLAFNIYLLGHDSVADQQVLFTRRPDGAHDIDWHGRIALSYAGDHDFRHRFQVRTSARLDYIRYPKALTAEQAYQRLRAVLDAPELFEPGLIDGQPAWVPKRR
ncbi:hypothetical protein F5X71_20740 [Nocardia brasiliensis]|uniref:Uncharacterized protein n=1 Tax=Nocardia brasiliensis TaxID=37326 RepID=A0A6G9XTZ3_NOCBR|nr:hypothetical protein [Nocardia brasiliensis]QIS04431.1 hypothetical protein F5X71_20740 [Nocardia brasiliensis]